VEMQQGSASCADRLQDFAPGCGAGSEDLVVAAAREPFYSAAPPNAGGTTALMHLESEVAALRRHGQSFLRSVGDIVFATMVTSPTADREIVPNSNAIAGGPWLLRLKIHGPGREQEAEMGALDSGAYDAEHVVELCFPPTYPAVLPRVRFRSFLMHPFIIDFGDRDHERRVGEPFFCELIRRFKVTQGTSNSESQCTLTFWLHPICELLHEMLRPEPMGGASVQVWSHIRRLNWETLDVIRRTRVNALHPEFYGVETGWMREWFDPSLADATSCDTGPERAIAIRDLVSEVSPGVFVFSLFTQDFCSLFLAELDNFNATGLPARPPSATKRFGIIMDDIGWHAMADELQQDVLQPIAEVLFPVEGARLDSHHSFVVRYTAGEDMSLDTDFDDSEVTFNVCLARSVRGGDLMFYENPGSSSNCHNQYAHRQKVGQCVVYHGRRRHGVDDIIAGEGLNLIIWNHNIMCRTAAAHRQQQLRGQLCGG